MCTCVTARVENQLAGTLYVCLLTCSHGVTVVLTCIPYFCCAEGFANAGHWRKFFTNGSYRRRGFLGTSKIEGHTLKQAHTFLLVFVHGNKCILSNYPNCDYFNSVDISPPRLAPCLRSSITHAKNVHSNCVMRINMSFLDWHSASI